MTISAHITSFYGLPIVEFTEATALDDPRGKAYRLGFDDRDDETDGETLVELFHAFLDQPNSQEVTALVFGTGEDYTYSYHLIVDAVTAAAASLPNLAAVFFAEVTFDQCEISWIEQADYDEFLRAFPKLKHLQIRGGSALQLGTVDHANLETLIIEAGGLHASEIRAVTSATLPALRHLELWLGTEDYGFNGSIGDLAPLLLKDCFPKLRYLGLRNSEIADEIAAEIVASPLLAHVETLDLSLGTLSDDGAESLLRSSAVPRLKRLNLEHHYLSPEMMARFSALGIAVDLGNPQTADDGDRYVAVGE